MALRTEARMEVHRRLVHGPSFEQRYRLDALTERREETSQSWLAWLRQMPEAAKPASMLSLIERLKHARAVSIEPGRGHLVHQARLAQLAREAGRTTVQHVAGYERQRRHATLVATTLDLSASLTDAAIDLFDRLVGAMFRKAEGRHTRAFQADARAINDKVRLYARVGGALIAARAREKDAFEAITAVVTWDRFCATVAKAEALVTCLPGRVRVRKRAGVCLLDACHRRAAGNERRRALHLAQVRANRLCDPALGSAGDAGRHS